MLGKTGAHTLCGPGHAPAERGLVLVDLGPDLPLAVPCCGRLACRDFGDVESHGARVGDGGLGVVGDRRPGRDGVDARGPRAGFELVAADLLGSDVRYGPVALVVCCRPDILPVRRAGNAGKGV